MTLTSSQEDPTTNELPDDFTPSDYDVICGWARQNYHHPGNHRLRELISEAVPTYLAASTKTEKGKVIVEIVQRLRQESPKGVGLVRQNPKNGRWYFIGTEKAKDKIGHALRKASQEVQGRSESARRKVKGTKRWHQHSLSDSRIDLLSTCSSESTADTTASNHKYEGSEKSSGLHHAMTCTPKYAPYPPPPYGSTTVPSFASYPPPPPSYPMERYRSLTYPGSWNGAQHPQHYHFHYHMEPTDKDGTRIPADQHSRSPYHVEYDSQTAPHDSYPGRHQYIRFNLGGRVGLPMDGREVRTEPPRDER